VVVSRGKLRRKALELWDMCGMVEDGQDGKWGQEHREEDKVTEVPGTTHTLSEMMTSLEGLE
jgi:hypothetical protein